MMPGMPAGEIRMPAPGPVGRSLAANIERLRQALGLSPRKLSAELDKAGRPIPPHSLARIARGERRVDVDELVALAKVLGVTPDVLLSSPEEVRAAPAEGGPELPVIDPRVVSWDELVARREDSERRGENWWAFALGVAGITLPLVLLTYPFAQAGHIEWPLITSEIRAGAFLLPIVILCIDTVRRAFRNLGYAMTALKLVNYATAFICMLTALYSFLVAAFIQTQRITTATAHAVTLISIGGLVASITLSFIEIVIANTRR
jgi:transcriptional regulator with XRE-family HTH domain